MRRQAGAVDGLLCDPGHAVEGLGVALDPDEAVGAPVEGLADHLDAIGVAAGEDDGGAGGDVGPDDAFADVARATEDDGGLPGQVGGDRFVHDMYSLSSTPAGSMLKLSRKTLRRS